MQRWSPRIPGGQRRASSATGNEEGDVEFARLVHAPPLHRLGESLELPLSNSLVEIERNDGQPCKPRDSDVTKLGRSSYGLP